MSTASSPVDSPMSPRRPNCLRTIPPCATMAAYSRRRPHRLLWHGQLPTQDARQASHVFAAWESRRCRSRSRSTSRRRAAQDRAGRTARGRGQGEHAPRRAGAWSTRAICGRDDRIVINLAPAELPKQAASFDLPITLGILAGSGQIASRAVRSLRRRRRAGARRQHAADARRAVDRHGRRPAERARAGWSCPRRARPKRPWSRASR